MAFIKGKCAVCGAQPTVKSHIIPRGLAHDLRAESTHLISGSVFRPGLSHLQSGRWDGNILCAQHEAALTAYDDYGIRFIRSFRETKFTESEPTTIVPNPKPVSLQLFFLGMIWRKDLSNQAAGEASKLGPYSDRIRDALFNRAPIRAPVIVLRSPTMIEGQRVAIFVEPHPTKLGKLNAWKCDLGWMAAAVVLDRRPLIAEWQPLDVSKCENAEVTNLDRIDIRNMEILKPILANMLQQRRRQPSTR